MIVLYLTTKRSRQSIAISEIKQTFSTLSALCLYFLSVKQVITVLSIKSVYKLIKEAAKNDLIKTLNIKTLNLVQKVGR